MGKTDVYLDIQQSLDKLEQLSAAINRDTLISEEKAKFIKAQTKELDSINKKIEEAKATYDQDMINIEHNKGELLDTIVPIRKEVDQLQLTHTALVKELVDGKQLLSDFKVSMKEETDKIKADYKALETKLNEEHIANEKKYKEKLEEYSKLDKNIINAKENIAKLEAQALKFSGLQGELETINKEIKEKQKKLSDISISLENDTEADKMIKLSIKSGKEKMVTVEGMIAELKTVKDGLATEIEDINKQKFSLAKREGDLILKEEFIKSKYEAAGVRYI